MPASHAPARKKASLLAPRNLIVAAIAVVLVVASFFLANWHKANNFLAQQRAWVEFQYGTPHATVASAGQRCSSVPGATRVAPPPGTLPLQRLRYDVSKATPQDLAQLRSCVQKFRGVTGIMIVDLAKPQPAS